MCESVQKNLAETPYQVTQVIRELNGLRELVSGGPDEPQSIVILIDRKGRGAEILERLREAKSRIPNAKFVVISPNDVVSRIVDWIRAGADAFLRNADQEELLIPTLKLVTVGMLVMPDAALELLRNETASDQIVPRPAIE